MVNIAVGFGQQYSVLGGLKFKCLYKELFAVVFPL